MRKHLAGAILKYISIKQVFLRGESEIKKFSWCTSEASSSTLRDLMVIEAPRFLYY